MTGDVEDLSQLDLTIGISNVISNDGVAQLSDKVGEGLAALDDKGKVSRARARLDADGGDVLESQGVGVEGVEVDEIHSQIRDEQELARGVEDRLVRVRGILTRRVGGRAGQLEVLGLKELQLAGVGDVPGGEGRATTKKKITVSFLRSLIYTHVHKTSGSITQLMETY